MEYVRYFVLIIILSGSTTIGFLLAKRYQDRVKELKELVDILNIMKNKIRFSHTPMKEVLKEISEVKRNSPISEVFLIISKKIEKENVSKVWRETLNSEKENLNFKDEDIKIIENLGNVLGKTDIDGQMSAFEEFNIMIDSNIKRAEIEKNKNEKMYKSLGILVGLAIVIILI